MAITVDQSTIGQTAEVGDGTTVAITTTAAVASSATIVIGIVWYTDTGTEVISTISDGTNTYTVHGTPTQVGNYRIVLATAYAASGLASSSTITVTFSDSVAARQACASSFLSVLDSSPLDDTAGDALTDPPEANPVWTTGTLTTTQDGDLLVGLSYNGGLFASTPTSPCVETHDFQVGTPADNTVTMLYRLATSAGNYTPGGQWNSDAWIGWGAFGIALKASTITLDQVLPDADITTTGWSTAPLFSKVNDASDATVITATAS